MKSYKESRVVESGDAFCHECNLRVYECDKCKNSFDFGNIVFCWKGGLHHFCASCFDNIKRDRKVVTIPK